MEHIVAAWDMAGLAIVAPATEHIVAAGVLAGRKIVAPATGPAVAEVLVGYQVDNCP